MSATRVEKAEQNRKKLLASARKAFAEKGYAEASMDELTAEAGLTRGALYHSFGDKRGLLAAVVDQIDSEMAAKAKIRASSAQNDWDAMLLEAKAYIEMALEPEVQQIVLRDGPAVLGDPSRWPSQSSCLAETLRTVESLIAKGILRPVDPEAASRLLSGAAFNAAMWVAAKENPQASLSQAIEAFKALAEGLLLDRQS
ncbi:TetR family transcriptional regulator [Rhizobium sp. Root149]|jgi:AcrR family transcriptional regulator|uniref:AcrR family transcriptional regulator n=1 Tax=Rhizobium rhizoryzae TaxID=451876 RepID=A0A7W6LEJ1_9HYPH|nr:MULTISPECIES: TetR/AcrR family transcriptional regulator [Rhizobium]KQZ54674.1 TetR family transcriptional regulator [Rhizobium sp. Root149]MBB4141757.1 AcrR family transcriptional regulator [Rhizobium rhizoryzae]